MMANIRKVRFGTIMCYALYLLSLSGCTAGAVIGAFVGGTAIGAGTYRYISGVLEREYPVDYETAWKVSKEALTDLSIGIAAVIDQRTKGKIEAVREDGTPIDIYIEDRGNNVCTIGVRVGRLGDRRESIVIHDKIRALIEKEAHVRTDL